MPDARHEPALCRQCCARRRIVGLFTTTIHSPKIIYAHRLRSSTPHRQRVCSHSPIAPSSFLQVAIISTTNTQGEWFSRAPAHERRVVYRPTPTGRDTTYRSTLTIKHRIVYRHAGTGGGKEAFRTLCYRFVTSLLPLRWF